ncbi:hypothetical protein Daus18300_006574 [Diaporthe australafricana]|uniref:Uncharacterized protein n=1 Tax=Diaporthe australafricana TaxID=127596 RepID=A0ABR3WT78_9PEZI
MLESQSDSHDSFQEQLDKKCIVMFGEAMDREENDPKTKENIEACIAIVKKHGCPPQRGSCIWAIDGEARITTTEEFNICFRQDPEFKDRCREVFSMPVPSSISFGIDAPGIYSN